MVNIGCIGWGVVGKAVGEGFSAQPDFNVFWYDKHIKGPYSFEDVASRSDFIFVSVPTPMFADNSGIDLSIMDEVVDKLAPLIQGTPKIVIIKSTVIPGTTSGYSKKYPNVKFAMNPESLTEVNAEWDFMNPDRIVIGSDDEPVAMKIARLYRKLNGHNVKMFLTDSTTAEMVKYMSNTFLATKIIFANEMKQLSDRLGVNYDDVKKMVALDPRIGDSFLSVSPWGGFGAKCFPKDTVALLGLAKKINVDLSLIKAAWKKNLKIRKVRDWEDIEGAVNFQTNGKTKTDIRHITKKAKIVKSGNGKSKLTSIR